MIDAPHLPSISTVERRNDEVILALMVPANLVWFRGHFPDVPILPGVVQIDWAVKLAREYLGLTLPAARDFKVKFRSIIGPGDRLVLTLRHRAEKRDLFFEYRRGDTACSSGQIRTAP